MAVPSIEELDQMLLHQRIRKTREGLPMTQQKFALEVEVSERQVKRWESGTHNPTRENGEKIASLAKRPAELFTPPLGEDVGRPVARILEDILHRLDAVEGKVDLLATKEELQAGLETLRAAIHAQASGGTQAGSETVIVP